MKRNVRTLHNRSGANRELVAAVIAEVHTGLRLPAHDTGAGRSTVRASRFAVRPARRGDVRQCLVFVVEDRVGDVDVHGLFPLSRLYAD